MIADMILKINKRLQFLIDVGLEYLTLSRSAGTTIWRRSSTYSFSNTNWIWTYRSLCIF